MSERLPLFPLHTVLYPGVPIKLHIFEERYRRMMAGVIEGSREFGVVLIKEGREALGPLALFHSRGCTARITHIEPLPAGRMNLLALGETRFNVESAKTEDGYLVGDVIRLAPLRNDSTDEFAAQDEIRELLVRYFKRLNRPIDATQLPEGLTELAYTAAYLIPIAQHRKQELLDQDRLSDLVDSLLDTLRQQLAMLEFMSKAAGTGAGDSTYNPN